VSTTTLRLLHLEDDDADADLVRKTLEHEGVICVVTRVDTEAGFRSSLVHGGFDLILADYTLPEFDGISALNLAREMLPDVPFIFLSGTLDEDVAIDALKIGATDYVFKTRLSRIAPSLRRALREAADLAERKQHELLLAGEKRLLEMIARGGSRPVILDALCHLVEELAGGSLSSILLVDPDGRRLRHGAAPSLAGTYVAAIDGSVIGPSAGSCGTAAHSGQPVVVSDIATDPLWNNYRELALAHGLRACWSTPILSSEGRVLGTFAIYYREPRTPTPHEHNVVERVTHLASIAIERERAEGVLRELAGRLIDAQEEERKRIGRELHDHISQTLGVLTIKIDQLCANSEITAGVAGPLRELRRDTSEIAADVRRLSHRLHSSTLDYLGLVPALQKLVAEFSERHGIAIALAHATLPPSLPSEVALCLFRVAEESLANVARHSKALSAGVHVAGAPDGIHLTVEDAGTGFDVTTLGRRAGLGFVSMQERLRVLHGTIHVDSTPAQGTRIEVWVPSASLLIGAPATEQDGTPAVPSFRS
jgi:signal transduction histidine kinase